MGRFGRRSVRAREMAALYASIAELREQLDAERYATDELRFRLHELERRDHELALRTASFRENELTSVGASASAQPLPVRPKRSGGRSSPTEDATSGESGGGAAGGSGEARHAAAPAEPTQIPTPPPPSPPLSIDRLAQVAEAASSLSERNDWAIEEVRTALARLNTRLDELAFLVQNQLRDLGFEIERAAASTRTSAAVSDLALDRQLESLRHAQVRIANEQARYEIALRTELADVADALRRFT